MSAVQLVLQAGAQGKGGEVFVLDMGDPVRISDLAEDLVRLSGLELGSDIEICETPTAHPKILQARDHNSTDGLDTYVHDLIEAARQRAPEEELRRMIKALVPEYAPPAHSDLRRAETVEELAEAEDERGSAKI